MPSTESGGGRKSFYRKGECSGWVDDLSADEIIEMEQLCKDFMNYWGYSNWGGAMMPRSGLLSI